jgi:hypothetical protein
MAKMIYSKRDALTGDSLEVQLDAGRLVFETVVAGRPRRVFILVDAQREGLALAENLRRALTVQAGHVRVPRTVRLS